MSCQDRHKRFTSHWWHYNQYSKRDNLIGKGKVLAAYKKAKNPGRLRLLLRYLKYQNASKIIGQKEISTYREFYEMTDMHNFTYYFQSGAGYEKN